MKEIEQIIKKLEQIKFLKKWDFFYVWSFLYVATEIIFDDDQIKISSISDDWDVFYNRIYNMENVLEFNTFEWNVEDEENKRQFLSNLHHEYDVLSKKLKDIKEILLREDYI